MKISLCGIIQMCFVVLNFNFITNSCINQASLRIVFEIKKCIVFFKINKTVTCTTVLYYYCYCTTIIVPHPSLVSVFFYFDKNSILFDGKNYEESTLISKV